MRANDRGWEPEGLRPWRRLLRLAGSWWWLSLAAWAAGSFACAKAGAQAGTEVGAEWRLYGGDPTGSKYSPLRQIRRSNVGRLRPAWIYRCDDMRSEPASTIECNPIVVDGFLYLTTPGLKVVALDAATGRERWRFDPWQGRGGRGVNRGVTHWASDTGQEARIFFAAGPMLHALDAATGRPMETFGVGGRVDLRDGLDRDVFYLPVTATTPGVVFGDLLILGSAVGEGPGPAAPGHIRAYDVRTGARRWIFHTIPHPGEPGYETWPGEAWKTAGGANCWGGMTVDVARGMVFCGTGSPSYDHWGGNRIGANLFANCVLALRASTGERLWHFQVVHHDVWDYDIPAPPNLVTVRHGGRTRDAVAQVSKVGHLFLLDRETGKPLFPVVERPVPPSTVPGERTWPTQPFPLKPPPFAAQTFTETEVTDRGASARDAVLGRLRGMRTGGIFLPPGLEPSVVLPQFNGGAEWGGAAFDPRSRTLFVNASNEAEWISMMPSTLSADVTLNELGRRLYGTICSACHAKEAPAEAGVPGAASLRNVRQRLTREQVAALLVTGRGQMPSFASLSALERRAAVAFLWGDGLEERVPGAGLRLSFADEVPYVATGHHEFRDPEGFPANRRPWGTLTAVDLDRGEFRWQVPLGTYPALEARGEPPTGTFNIGGPLVTAGGLVFIGASMDERFHAFDARNGRMLWEYPLGAGGYATPSTYAIGGRQYVVIAAGGGGKPETRPGNAYYCFTLDGEPGERRGRPAIRGSGRSGVRRLP